MKTQRVEEAPPPGASLLPENKTISAGLSESEALAPKSRLDGHPEGPPACPGLRTGNAQLLVGQGQNRRGNRSVDANTQCGDTVSLVLLPETNLSEGKGLLGPKERFGQTRLERAEELEALVKTGCWEANPVRGPRVEGREPAGQGSVPAAEWGPQEVSHLPSENRRWEQSERAHEGPPSL